MSVKTLTSLALAFTIATLSGCIIHINSSDSDGPGAMSWSGYDAHRIVGSNVLLTEVRSVDDFHSVMVAGAMDVTIDVGEPASIEVSGDSNLVPHLKTNVENGVLEIAMQDGGYKFRQAMKVHIVAPEVKVVELFGSGDVTMNGVESSDLRLEVYGSGDIKATGMVDRIEATVSGSGDISLYDLVAREARVRVAGSGDVRLHVTETLDAAISGSGDVRYKGTPAATVRTVGSGDVRSAN